MRDREQEWTDPNSVEDADLDADGVVSDADDDADHDDDVGDGEAASGLPDPRRRYPFGTALVGFAGLLSGIVALLRCHEPVREPSTLAMAEPSGGSPTASGEPRPTQPKHGRDNARPAVPHADATGIDPHPPAAPWAQGFEAPDTVTYTVRRGGTLENVANLYKIFHHEILALNPGVDLDRELAPGTAVVVYRREKGEVSESVGLPSRGSLEGAVPLLDGPGRHLKAIPWKTFATARTVWLLDKVLRQWAKAGHRQALLVGNASARDGGRLEPHATHQSGRDVDLSYPQTIRSGEELNWREMSASNLDVAETWQLLRLLAATGAIETVYIDRSLQKLLYEFALAQSVMSKRALASWMEYPRPTGSGNPLIAHVAGHTDHMHVRFACGDHESRCASR